MARRCTACEKKKASAHAHPTRKLTLPKGKVTTLKSYGSRISDNPRLMSLIKKGE